MKTRAMASFGELLAATAPAQALTLLAIAGIASLIAGPVLHAAVTTLVWSVRLAVLTIAAIYVLQLQNEPRLHEALSTTYTLVSQAFRIPRAPDAA